MNVVTSISVQVRDLTLLHIEIYAVPVNCCCFALLRLAKTSSGIEELFMIVVNTCVSGYTRLKEITMRDLANVFKALSDETRLEILALLLIGGELCVCDVEGSLGITQSKASRHLRYLLNAGLVDNRRVGVWMHYVIPSTIDPARREILKATRKIISKEKRVELQNKLNDWLVRKAESGETCAAS